MTAPVDPSISHARRVAVVLTYADSAATPGQWVARAACAGLGLHDDEIHGETREERDERYQRAAMVCRSCPVFAECDEWRRDTPRKRRVGVIAGRVRPPGRRGEINLLEVSDEAA